MYWTDEKVELLRQLWLDGKSASQIAAALGDGVTRNAVIGKVHRLGLSGRVKTATSAAPRIRQKSLAPRAPSVGRSSGGFRGNTALALARDMLIEAEPELREDVVIPMSLRVTIVELKEAMCRWPLGDPTTPEFRYCGIQTATDGPYCQHHSRLAYQPAQDRRRERERERRAAARML
ncbi:MAG TPA: GcrA family cell cycle regulator [Roseiarcus sp.]|nr:GcrA family cell cycle regulator [Roseiarcus sp.]